MASIKSKIKSAVKSVAKQFVAPLGQKSQTAAVLNAPLSPGLSIGTGGQITKTSGGLTSNLSQSNQVANAVKSIKQTPVNIGKAIASGGLTQGKVSVSGGKTIAPTNNISSRSVSIPSSGLDFGGSSQLSSLSATQGTNSINNVSSPYSSTINIPNALNANQLKPTSEFVFPEKKITEAPIIPPVINPIETATTDATKEKDTALEDYLKTITGEAPSSADAYARAQRETDILNKQKTVNDLTGKLNAIVNQGEANKLALIGQGRGIPEAIIGGQQAQIARETAIQALPIQAQLEAAQGNLEMANDNLDTLFKIYSDDARNEYEYKKEVKRAIYEYASEKEKRALEKLDKQEERAYQEFRDLHDEQNAYAKMAFATGQSNLGAKIAKLDYKSPTFKEELSNLSSQIVDSKRNLEIQKLQQDLANAGTTVNPKVLSTSQFKAAQAAQNLKLTLEKAKAAVQKYGNYEFLSGKGAGELNTLKVQLRSEISTALEQGVVVPGEAAAFDKIAGELNSSVFTRNSKTLSALDSLSKSMDGRVALQKAALTNTYKVSPEQIDTLLNITDLSDQEFADMDAIIE